MLISGVFMIALGVISWLFYPVRQLDCSTYAIQLDVEMIHDLNGVLGGEMATSKQQVAVQLKGELRRYCLKKQDSCQFFAYKYAPHRTTFLSNNQCLPERKITTFERDLQKPVLVKYALDGRILSVSTDSTISATAEMMQKNLISHFQFVESESSGSAWEAREDDASGTVIASYRQIPSDSKGSKYLKKKNKYLMISGNFGCLGTPDVQMNSSEEIVRGSDIAAFRRISFQENKTLLLRGGKAGQSDCHFLAQFIESNRLQGSEAQKIQNLPTKTAYAVWVPLYQLAANDKMKYDRQRTILQNTTVDGLCQKLANIKEWQDSVYNQLLAMLIVHPKSSDALAELLKKNGPTKLCFYMVSNAMTEVHSAECQKHLAEVIQARFNDWSTMYELLPLIAVMPEPAKTVEAIIRRLAFESPDENIRSTAQLALGGIAGNLRKSDPARAAKISSDLVQRLKGVVEPEQYLLVLGNTGSTLAMPEIKVYLSSKETDIATTAIESLRFIENEEAESIVAQLSKHQNKKIRLCAKEVMTIRQEQKKLFALSE